MSSSNILIGKRVLLVNDNAFVLDAMNMLLTEHLGAEVTTAINGKQGLEMLQRGQAIGSPFDLVVTDIEMSPLNGIGLMSQMGLLGLVTPTVVTSGNLSKYNDELGKFRPHILYKALQAPYSTEEFTTAVTGALKLEPVAV